MQTDSLPTTSMRMSPTELANKKTRTPGAFLAIYKLVLRHQITKGRLVLFGVIFVLSVTMGLVLSRSSDVVQDAVDLVSWIGLGLIVPVVPLVLGSAALGEWVEDETLVYVWLRPIRRWTIALAATLAAATIAVPVVVISMAIMGGLASRGDSGVITGAIVSSTIAGLAYTALFVGAGLIIKRALLWGLVYTFIWELFVARAGAGAARFSINSYSGSILARFSGIEIRLADRAEWSSYTIPVLVTFAALAFTTWRLNRANVA